MTMTGDAGMTLAGVGRPLSVHVITGFLGAGKTSLIAALLAARPAHERWAVLVNEFGRIGLDQVAWAGSGVLVKEVPGGCICCAQNLPWQIALGQIIAQPGLDRLLIEPTGLGHPAQILETLREPHWAAHLRVAASLCVVDARQLDDARVTGHETFQAQAGIADVLVFSKDDLLSGAQREQALAWAATLRPQPAVTAFSAPDRVDVAWLDAPPRGPRQLRRSLLHLRPQAAVAVAPGMAPQEPPYHYHEQALDRFVGGWILPAAWRFSHDALLTTLLSWRGMDRVKGVFHTDQGWIFFNATAQDLAIRSSEYRADNRVEMISAQPVDWAAREQELLAALAPAEDEQQSG